MNVERLKWRRTLVSVDKEPVGYIVPSGSQVCFVCASMCVCCVCSRPNSCAAWPMSSPCGFCSAIRELPSWLLTTRSVCVYQRASSLAAHHQVSVCLSESFQPGCSPPGQYVSVSELPSCLLTTRSMSFQFNVDNKMGETLLKHFQSVNGFLI